MGDFKTKGVVCEDGRVVVATGDITGIAVGAIVNAANSTLLGGGGVDGAIHRAGGEAILRECREIRSRDYPDGLPPGMAVRTTAGNLPAQYVIHTVGPVYRGGSKGEAAVLASAYRSSLDIARNSRITDIAFPAISTGVYGYPRELAAVVVQQTLSAYLREFDLPQTIYLVFFSASDSEIYLRSSQCR